MGSMTFPSTFSNKKKFPTIFQETNSQYSLQPKKKVYPHFIQLHNQKYISSVINLNQFYSLSCVSKGNSLLYPVKCNTKDNSATPEKGEKAVETVQKLYNALKNKNLNELYDIIGEECRGISNVVSSLQTFYGKEQVIDFFNSIIKLLGNNFEFVIQPTIHDGTSVRVAWELACRETHVPIGKGFGFYICHCYKGTMMIRNVEMFMYPLLHTEPVRLKVSSILLRTIQKMNPPNLFKGKKKQAMSILFIILLFAALLYLVKNSRNLM